MSNYEICYLAADGHIALCYFDNFTGDDHARWLAGRYLRPRMKSAEIWQGGALVGLLTLESPVSSIGRVSGASDN
jgi:hypothetical protein